MQAGVIRMWQDDRGFGFIAPSDGSPDVFFHINSLTPRAQPAQGQKVKFTLGLDGNGRPRAATVTVLGNEGD